MRIVRGSYERGIAQAVFLGSSEDRATIHLTLRNGLLQHRLLTGTNGLQLVEVHQQVVGQSHLLVELVRQVKVIQVILAQMRRQQPT